MASLDLKYLFPKTTYNKFPMTKQQIIARVQELKVKLNRENALSMSDLGREFCYCRIDQKQIENSSYRYVTEKQKSSKIRTYNMFVTHSNGNESPFQILSKTKDRKEVRQVWEFLALDYWYTLLSDYSKKHDICLAAPVPLFLRNQHLMMSREIGIIGNKIHLNLKDQQDDSYKLLPLYLGALAHIKDVEELQHGDYVLRHVLLRPKEVPVPFFLQYGLATLWPGLSVVDVEHSIRCSSSKVSAENDKLFISARNYISSFFKMKYREFEQSYRDGYDRINNMTLSQNIIDAQHEKWGFSLDRLF